MSIKELEDAFRTHWLLPVSGLAAGRVFFEHQKYNRPATGAYLTIRFASLAPRGVDATVNTFDPVGPAGQELIQTTTGRRDLRVSVQVWQAPTTSREDANPSAFDLASRLNTGIGRPRIRRRLVKSGIGIMSVGTVRDLSAVLGADFEGRAQFEILAYVKTVDIDRETFIEKVSGTVTIDNQDVPFDAVE